jgi:protein O-mannosyl-transferase
MKSRPEQSSVNRYDVAFKGRWPWVRPALLVVALVIAYQQVWHAGFIWDDDAHLTKNPCIVGPLGFKGIWTTAAATYYPLVLTNFWVQHALWGLNPLPYHLVNVAMHAACAVLLWRVLRQLKIKGAWLGAAIWALHPVQVESVAWVTELKNTQSCLFYLLSILFFLKWRERAASLQDRHGNWPNYVLSLLCAVAAILSKSSTVMLPVVLGLCSWWSDGKWRWRNSGALIPFLFASLAASAWTVWEQKFHSMAIGAEWNQTMLERFLVAGRIVLFYLAKLFWPHPLSFIYPRWQIDASQPLQYLPTIGVLFGLIILWGKRNGPLRPAFFAAAYFVVSLFPVLGFFNVYFFRFSYVGDHFQYLAGTGVLALVGSAIGDVNAGLRTKAAVRFRIACSGMLLLILGTMTWHQARIYCSVEALWHDTVNKNPASWMAQDSYGLVLLEKGRPAEALQHMEVALRLGSNVADTHACIGNLLMSLGRAQDALPQFQRALEIAPVYVRLHSDLGSALLALGRTDEAVAKFRDALKIDPLFAPALSHLGKAYQQLGRLDDSLNTLREALRIDPMEMSAHLHTANTLMRLGQVDEGVAHLRTALSIQPNDPDAQRSLAWVLATYPEARIRDGAKAVELAERADRSKQGLDPFAAATLAAAYAETNRFSEAIQTGERALQLANQSGTSFAQAIERHIELYRSGQPVRQPY